MRFPLEKYKYIILPDKRKVIAISTFGGKVVRGVATCGKEDIFDIDFGKKLAALRCNKKIAEKRMKRAQRESIKAGKALIEAEEKKYKMLNYLEDAKAEFKKANVELNEFLK